MTSSSRIDRALLGFTLPAVALSALHEHSIAAHAQLSLHFQRASRRHLLRGTGSGGAVPAVGRYVTFANCHGSPLPCFQPIDSLLPNGPHASVLAAALLRAEVFRVGHTYDVIVTRHVLGEPSAGARPRIVSDVVFPRVTGRLELDLVWPGFGTCRHWTWRQPNTRCQHGGASLSAFAPSALAGIHVRLRNSHEAPKAGPRTRRTPMNGRRYVPPRRKKTLRTITRVRGGEERSHSRRLGAEPVSPV